jgi:hypothetical protein
MSSLSANVVRPTPQQQALLLVLSVAAGATAEAALTCAGGCAPQPSGPCCCKGCTPTGTSPGMACGVDRVASYGCNSGCGSWCCCPRNATTCGTLCSQDTDCKGAPAGCSSCVRRPHDGTSVCGGPPSVSLASPVPPPPPGYELIAALSDEFEGTSLDASKWSTSQQVIRWPGRAPGLFDPSNVVVGGGRMQLWARATRRNGSWPAGYDNYTTAAVRSLASVREGYFEIRWRSGSSGISSSWWFHTNNGTAWTEIDVFETTGVDNPPPREDPGDPERCATTPLKHCRTGCPADEHGTCGPTKQPFKPGGPSCNMCECNKLNTTCASGGDKNTILPSHVHVFKLPGVTSADLPAQCDCKEGKPGPPPSCLAAFCAWRLHLLASLCLSLCRILWCQVNPHAPSLRTTQPRRRGAPASMWRR